LKTLAKGGNVYIVYTVDGVTAPRVANQIEVPRLIELREKEALNCLASIGIPQTNVHFLRNRNEYGLRDPENVEKTVYRVQHLIQQIKPYALVTSAFEGGHPDHDITNYIVARACERADYPRIRVYEAPEYNQYYLWNWLTTRKYINRFLLIKFYSGPKLPHSARTFTLPMSPQELEAKCAMLRLFPSEDSPKLVAMFGYPDQFRPIAHYDYSIGPFNPDRTIRHWLVKILKRGRPTFPFGLTYDDYLVLYRDLDFYFSELAQKGNEKRQQLS